MAHSVDGIHWHRPGLGLVTNTSIYSRWVRKGGELRTIGTQSNLIMIGLGRCGRSAGGASHCWLDVTGAAGGWETASPSLTAVSPVSCWRVSNVRMCPS